MQAENVCPQKVSDSITVYTSKEHSFGTDAVILAGFTAEILGGKTKNICDLGCGCGIIPLLLEERVSAQYIAGVDISEKAIEQFEQGIEDSTITCEMQAICADLKEHKAIPKHGSFDVVTSNPPYIKAGSGKQSGISERAVARHEVMCDIFDVCRTASKLLTTSGRLFLCHRPSRLPDVFEAMRKFGMEPKTMRMVVERAGEAPWLFVVEGRKSVGAQLTILPELVLRDNNGYTREYKEIYRKDDSCL